MFPFGSCFSLRYGGQQCAPDARALRCGRNPCTRGRVALDGGTLLPGFVQVWCCPNRQPGENLCMSVSFSALFLSFCLPVLGCTELCSQKSNSTLLGCLCARCPFFSFHLNIFGRELGSNQPNRLSGSKFLSV